MQSVLCISGNAFVLFFLQKKCFQMFSSFFKSRHIVLIPHHRVTIFHRPVCVVVVSRFSCLTSVLLVFLSCSLCPCVTLCPTRHPHHLASIHHPPPPSQPCRSHRSFRNPHLRPRAHWQQRYSTAPRLSTGPPAWSFTFPSALLLQLSERFPFTSSFYPVNVHFMFLHLPSLF